MLAPCDSSAEEEDCRPETGMEREKLQEPIFPQKVEGNPRGSGRGIGGCQWYARGVISAHIATLLTRSMYAEVAVVCVTITEVTHTYGSKPEQERRGEKDEGYRGSVGESERDSSIRAQRHRLARE